MWRNIGWALGVVVLIGFSGTALADPSKDAFEQKLEAELTALDAGALALFQQANAARAREDHRTAEKLYGEVFARVPAFIAAERRRCGELGQLGERQAALPLCQDAANKDPNSANLGALGITLLQLPNGQTPPQSDLDEAASALDRAAELEPKEVYLAQAQCQLALYQKSVPRLSACSARLEQLAPDDRSTIFSSWVLALSENRLSDAQGLVKRAKSLHFPASMVEHMSAETDAAVPWTTRALTWAALVLGVWAALSGVLVLIGTLLSRITLRTAENWNAESAARTRALRAIYGQVLLVCSALYYVSLPLVLLLAFGSAGALIYAMLAIGYIPIKLGLLILVGAFASGGAIIKSITFRPHEEEPGIKVDLAREPALKQTLLEVADRIGTRPVDTVYMTPDTGLAVFERKNGERCLVLGAGVLERLPLSAFKAILGHEYGHFSHRDTAGGGLALRVRRSLLLLIVGIARSGHATPWNLTWWFANGYHRLFLRVSQGASRLQEILADRRAAEAYGGLAFATGLRHVAACDLAFDTHINGQITRALEAKEPLSNLWSPPAPALEPASASEKLEAALSRKPSPYDSHPAPADRIRWVERISGTAESPEEPSVTAWTLFSDRAAQERELTLLVYQQLAASGVHPVAPPRREVVSAGPT
jgi:Zn-dependent protease with chaperone function